MKSLFDRIPREGPWWLAPARIFDGYRWRSDHAMKIEGGRITAMAQQDALDPNAVAVRVDYLACPGYVDLQVNGGGGVLFNNAPEPAMIATIGEAHLRLGTTAWLPTFITDTADRLDLAADAVIASMGQHGVVGIHIEGPHISVARRGTHSAAFIRPFDDRTMASLCRLRTADVPTLFTAAPECLPAGLIRVLRQMGVVVSIGHTAATTAETEAALEEGATCFTHLHNAMSPMTSRDPGVVGAALDSDAWCGIIADGHHVSDTTLAISIRARPRPDRTFLVSDAMATVGGPEEFDLYDERIRVVGGRLVNASGSLAGANIDMARSVSHLVNRLGLASERALAMATSVPAEVMTLADRIGVLRTGAKADFLLLDPAMSVVAVAREGRIASSGIGQWLSTA